MRSACTTYLWYFFCKLWLYLPRFFSLSLFLQDEVELLPFLYISWSFVSPLESPWDHCKPQTLALCWQSYISTDTKLDPFVRSPRTFSLGPSKCWDQEPPAARIHSKNKPNKTLRHLINLKCRKCCLYVHWMNLPSPILSWLSHLGGLWQRKVENAFTSVYIYLLKQMKYASVYSFNTRKAFYDPLSVFPNPQIKPSKWLNYWFKVILWGFFLIEWSQRMISLSL